MLDKIRLSVLKWIVPLLAVASALLYTFCILFSFDSEIGYFDSSPLLIATRIVFGLSLVVPLFFVFAAKDVRDYPMAYDPSAVALRRYDRKLAAFPVLGLLVCGSGLMIPFTSAINAVCAVFCLVGIIFFAQMLGTKMSALWGLPIIVFCLIRLYVVYTNFHIPLNSPLKESVLYGLLAIMLVVLAFNILGDGLRDALDPKLKQAKAMRKVVMGKKAKKAAEQAAATAAGSVQRELDPDTVLDVQDLVVNYVLEDETVEAVNGISFSLKKGKTLGLVGETGAGKTSTALSILNLVQTPPGVIKNGSINVCGHDMLNMTKRQLESVRGNDISMIFQDPMTALNPVMTVGEQIAESVTYHEGVSHSEALAKAEKMLELVGIPAERSGEYPHQFSGGMKQRVVIAIALACNPNVLLMDEPTTALDVTIQAQILDLMIDLRNRLGTAMLMITHDLGVVAKICDEVAVVYAGKVVEYGTLDDIFNHMMHPYTEGLFNSLPNVDDSSAELIPIPGLMPDPTKLPVGCAFEPRCRYATEKCKQPCSARAVSDTHMVMCARYDEPEFRIDMNKTSL